MCIWTIFYMGLCVFRHMAVTPLYLPPHCLPLCSSSDAKVASNRYWFTLCEVDIIYTEWIIYTQMDVTYTSGYFIPEVGIIYASGCIIPEVGFIYPEWIFYTRSGCYRQEVDILYTKWILRDKDI